MDLFELLFLALFILFPLLEGVLRRKRQPGPGGAGETDAEEDLEGWSSGPEGQPRAEQEEAGSAADMVPEDLWSVLTGEQRAPEPEPAAQTPAGDAGWWVEDEEVAVLTEPEPALEPEPETELPASLDDYRPTVVSLEQPVEDPEVRHRRFHEVLERPRPRIRPRPAPSTNPIAAALRDPRSARQAFVLSEILAPPKGLE